MATDLKLQCQALPRPPDRCPCEGFLQYMAEAWALQQSHCRSSPVYLQCCNLLFVQRSPSPVRHSTFFIPCSSFNVHHPMFFIHFSTFVNPRLRTPSPVLHSTLIIPRSSFDVHQPMFLIPFFMFVNPCSPSAVRQSTFANPCSSSLFAIPFLPCPFHSPHSVTHLNIM